MFTLFAFVTLTASAFAQYNPHDNDLGKDNDFAYKSNGNRHNNHGNNGYYFSVRERDMQIAQINREYDRKIQAVQNRLFMNYFKKQKMIRALDEKRYSQIRIVYAKFNDPHNRFDDRHFNRY